MIKIISFLKISLFLLVIFTIISSGTFFYFLWKYSPELPSYEKIVNYKPNLSSRVYSSDGLLLKSFYIEERIFIPIERIPKKIIQAFLSAEDKKFYSHFGIDPLAIFRATFVNIYNKFINNKMIGASTITQQVVKNLLLTNEVSFERKIKEMILAIRLEIILNKERILELYLNDIYLGYGSYGIAAASLNYFNKSLWDLSLDEMAFLAALPKAPNNYNPKRYYKKAIKRRNWVLDRMYENNFISIKDLEYKENKLIVQNRNENKFEAAKYFREETRKQLNNLLGYKELYNEGYIVKTTIDTQLQKIADDVFVEGLIHYDKKQGWRGPLKNSKTNLISDESYIDNFKNPFPKKWKLYQIIDLNNDTIRVIDKEGNMTSLDFVLENKWIKDYKFKIGDIFYAEYKDELIIRQLPQANGGIIVIDPHTGKILAITGGFSYDLSEFNRATQAWRQPGSAFKPFVYLSALKEGYTPSTLILDAPYVVDQGPGLPKWKPSNYTEKFYGISTMRTGIEKSRNLMTIRLSDKIGIQKILKTAKDFKIHQRLNDNLSMSLGAGLVTLQNITNAYAMIVNGGKEIAPTLIQSVYDKQGKLIINNIKVECKDCFQNSEEINFSLPKIEKKENTIIDSVIAYQMTSMLEGVVRNGTGKKISNIGVTLAGKTGTTNDNKDAWFIGFSPDLVVGVYVGYDKPKSLGYKQTGSAVAVPIFKNFMEKAKINKENIPFRIPSGISFVKIDSKTGLQTKSKNGVLEAFIIGTEPFNQNVKKLDDLGSINKDTISGTGSLLIN